MYDWNPGGPEHAKMMGFDILCRIFVDMKPPAPHTGHTSHLGSGASILIFLGVRGSGMCTPQKNKKAGSRQSAEHVLAICINSF